LIGKGTQTRPYQTKTNPMIRASAIRGMDTLALDFENQCKKHTLSDYRTEHSAPNVDEFIPLQHYAESLARATRLCKSEDFALVFGNRFDAVNLGPLGYALNYAENLGDALTLFCEKFEVVQDQTQITLEIDGDIARLRYYVEEGGLSTYDADTDAEASIGILHGICRRAVGPDWHASAMTFSHARSRPNDLIRQLFGVNSFFDRKANSLSFDRKFLAQPIQTHDPYLYRLLLNDIETNLRNKHRESELKDSVQFLIEKAITNNIEFSLPAIAAEIGMTGRALSDKLRLHGTGYRTIVMSARINLAKPLIRDSNLSLTQIALEVGFSEASALSRAFRQAGEETPIAYRKKYMQS